MFCLNRSIYFTEYIFFRMLALQYKISVFRYIWMRFIGGRFFRTFVGQGAFLNLTRVSEPVLPSDSWVRIRPVLSGICGSDVAAVMGTSSIYLSAFLSSPFIPGHEVVGHVIELGSKVNTVKEGDRVVIEPALGCLVRGFQDLCLPCSEGYYGNCERITMGDISSGIQTGYCRDTSGGWGMQLVAHESQIHHVPDEISDAAAVLIEPLSCAVHGVLKAALNKRAKVLVVGCGSIGLLTIVALRYFAPSCTIIALAKHAHQQKSASELGADYVVSANADSYKELAQLLSKDLYRLPIGKPAVMGGFDATFECSGSPSGVEDALRWTRSHGQVVMLGMPHVSKIDLVPFWSKELTLYGSYTYGTETRKNDLVRTFKLVIELLSDNTLVQQIEELVTHRFPLKRYRKALATALSPAKSEAVKVVFDFREEDL
jgi:threonine dehydrogenase-like Zn-dependent dehydrogenase